MGKEISSRRLALAAVGYFTLFLNLAFWREVWERSPLTGVGDLLFILSIPVVMFIVLLFAFDILLWPRIAKPLLAVLLVLSAAANYFMFELGLFIDSGMMRNVFATNPQEAGEMFTLRGLVWVLALGVLPAALVVTAKIVWKPVRQEIRSRARDFLVCLALLAVMAAGLQGRYRRYGKDHRVVSKLLNPANYLVSSVKCLGFYLTYGSQMTVIDEDPLHNPYEDPHLTVLVLVVGETARSVSFSLNGYERKTNPKLERQDVISFPDVTASNTYTDFALPCLFSHLPRKRFIPDEAFNTESLLDVMARAGYDVFWYDNYGGSKGVSDRVPTVDMRQAGDPKHRNGDFNYDMVLLDGLEEKLRTLTKDTVIVLHMMGSHGPRYFRRYPPEFRVFTPTADTADIQGHPREEVVNAYDNTILYTDHVLSEAVDILKKFPRLEAGLVYISDHGESTGENGIYLHGAPYDIAPREQLLVPFILWMSEAMKTYDHVDYEKLRAAAPAMKLSHDNFFHSILGLVEIESELYDESLDLFHDFRTNPLPYK